MQIMGTLWRSQPVELCELFLQTDAAFDVIAALGDLVSHDVTLFTQADTL